MRLSRSITLVYLLVICEFLLAEQSPFQAGHLAGNDEMICQIEEEGLGCWNKDLKPINLGFIPDYGKPITISASSSTICLNGSEAVVCWTTSNDEPEIVGRIPELSNSDRIAVSEGRLCFVKSNAIRCIGLLADAVQTALPTSFSDLSSTSELIALDKAICKFSPSDKDEEETIECFQFPDQRIVRFKGRPLRAEGHGNTLCFLSSHHVDYRLADRIDKHEGKWINGGALLNRLKCYEPLRDVDTLSDYRFDQLGERASASRKRPVHGVRKIAFINDNVCAFGRTRYRKPFNHWTVDATQEWVVCLNEQQKVIDRSLTFQFSNISPNFASKTVTMGDKVCYADTKGRSYSEIRCMNPSDPYGSDRLVSLEISTKPHPIRLLSFRVQNLNILIKSLNYLKLSLTTPAAEAVGSAVSRLESIDHNTEERSQILEARRAVMRQLAKEIDIEASPYLRETIAPAFYRDLNIESASD